MHVHPEIAELDEVLAAAFGARPVACCEGGGLVEEEELGEPPGLEQLSAPPLELESAGDPSPDLPVADQPSALVVKDASVAEQEPASLGGDDVPERRHPVAAWH